MWHWSFVKAKEENIFSLRWWWWIWDRGEGEVDTSVKHTILWLWLWKSTLTFSGLCLLIWLWVVFVFSKTLFVPFINFDNCIWLSGCRAFLVHKFWCILSPGKWCHQYSCKICWLVHKRFNKNCLLMMKSIGTLTTCDHVEFPMWKYW